MQGAAADDLHQKPSGGIAFGQVEQHVDRLQLGEGDDRRAGADDVAGIDRADAGHALGAGLLVMLLASVNYVGNTSLMVGIKVIAENVKTGIVKHTNTSYFTMVAKDESGKTTSVPHLILSDLQEVRRFFDSLRRINQKKKLVTLEEKFDHKSKESLELLKKYNVIVNYNLDI